MIDRRALGHRTARASDSRILAFVLALFAASALAQLSPESTETLSATMLQGLGEQLVAGDLDGDGDDELFVVASNGWAVYQRLDSGEYALVGEVDLPFPSVFAVCDVIPEVPGEELIWGFPEAADIAGDEAGVVQILTTELSGGGITLDIVTRFDQHDANVPGNGTVEPEAGDHFGATLAAGDFNGDGICDVAIGAPDEDLGPDVDAGSVHVFLGPVDPDTGSATFLPQIVQGSNGVPGVTEDGDRFGSVLSSGRIEDTLLDGDQLVVGAPDEVLPSSDEGAVWVVPYGTTEFLVDDATLFYAQELGFDGGPNDRFGASLATGDLDGNGWDELAIGAPRTTVDGVSSSAGVVYVVPGWGPFSPPSSAEQLTILSTGVSSSFAEHFGESVAIGQTDGDLFSDLAVGVPFDPLVSSRGTPAHGSIQIFTGGSDALSFQRQIVQSDIPGEDTEVEHFGEVLLFADTRADGTADLLVGVPRENLIQGGDDTGVVQLVPSAGRMRRAALLSQVGELSPHDRGTTPSLTERIGNYAVNGDGTAVFGRSDSDESSLETSDGTVLVYGVDLDAGGVATGAGSPFAWIDRAPGTLASSAGVLGQVGDSSPDGGTYSDFNQLMLDDSGHAHWIGDTTSNRHLYRSVPGSGIVDRLLSIGDPLPGGGTVGDIHRFDLSHGGNHLLASLAPGILWLDGAVVQREGEIFAPTGIAYRDVISISVNSSGNFVFNARPEMSIGSTLDRFVSSAGSEITNTTTIGPVFLEGMEARAVAINDAGETVGVFEHFRRGGVVFLACDPADLSAAVPLLITGDVLDVDGDGSGELKVTGLPHLGLEQPELTTGGTAFLRLEVEDLTGATEERDALVGLATNGCPLFADGYESGDTSAWSLTTP
ncbi:MAG: hypothetical protein DWQ36_06490 [Acidobacteria bacterium]|nr:MAG: hypothetical protein DWQ36_06490 [Acidobacteriota bacterium]